MKKLHVLAVVAGTLALAACSSSGGSASSSGAGGSTSSTPSTARLAIGFVSPIAAQPGQAALDAGLKVTASGLGWTVQFYDANLSSSAQVSDVQTLIQQKKSAIGLWPLDAGALEGTFAQAAAAKIPIVAVNTAGAGIDKTVYWQTDLCNGPTAPYRIDAKTIEKDHPGGQVLIMNGPPVPSIEAAVTCFKSAAIAAGLKVVGEAANTDDTSAGAASLASDLITKHPGVNAFWAYNDSSALGISSALISAGKKIQTGHSTAGVWVEGSNGDAAAITAVRQGRLTGTWDPNSTATGAAVAKAIHDYLTTGSKAPLIVKATFYDSATIGSYVPPARRHYTISDVPLVP